MPDVDPAKHRRNVNYLVRVLQKNPLEESAAIIRDRNRKLGLREKAVALPLAGANHGANVDVNRKHREKTLQQVERLRKSVWTAPLEELRAELPKCDVASFPDIKATVDRLATIIAHREELPALAEKSGFDGHFLSVFKEVLESPPREVAILKEQVLNSFQKSKVRRSGKRMVKLLKSELPALYELETSWLDSLARFKPSFAVTVRTNPVSQMMGMPWWIYPLIIVGGKLAAHIIGGGLGPDND